MTNTKKVDDGGPAFARPTAFLSGSGHRFEEGAEGMSYRRWLAGMAMSGQMAGLKPADEDVIKQAGMTVEQGVAVIAWKLADAMITAEKEVL